jgi:hypothetical protein
MKSWFITREPYLLYDMDGRVYKQEWLQIAQRDKRLVKVTESEDSRAKFLEKYRYQDNGYLLHVYNRIVIRPNNQKCIDLGQEIANKLGVNYFEDVEG